MADDAGADLAPPDHTYRGEGEIPRDALIVAIHPSVEEIPDDLFAGHNQLEIVRFHGNSRLLRIGNQAFLGCSSLRGFRCPKSVTNIGVAAFHQCSNMKEIALPGGLKTIEKLTFFLCLSLVAIQIPPSVARIGDHAFAACGNLASVGLAGGLRRIGDNAFQYCRSLGSVRIPSSTEHVGEAAFHNCRHLSLVRLHEDLRTLGRSAFRGCPMVTFQFVRLSERTEAIALDERGAFELEGSLNEASDALVRGSPNAWEECRESLRRAHIVLTDSLKEVMTTLELALWKKKIGEEDERDPRPTRQECRVNCGADMNIAIREVLGFIPPPWPRI